MDCFTVRDVATHTTYRKIDESEYNRLLALSYQEADSEIRDNLPKDVLFGYGYYGFKLTRRGEDCYLGITVGNTCD